MRVACSKFGKPFLIALAVLMLVGCGKSGSGNGGSSSSSSKLSNMEIYELRDKLERQAGTLIRLDRGQGFGAHIDGFAKYFRIGNDALSHNDFATASDAFQRAEREAKWLYEHEARRQAEIARRQEEERRRAEEARRRAEEARRQALATGDIVLDLPGGVKLALVKVAAGSFMMGSPAGETGRYDDESLHRVTLTRDFYLGRTEVTQAQWRAVMGTDPSYFKGDDWPVEQVSWNDAMAFCRKLNEMGLAPAGWKFTLPTEAQWEYAARGGNRSRGFVYAGGNDIGEVAWYIGNSGYKTHPVVTRRANELGLYDMSGNVWEWCLDWYGSYGGDTTDPAGPSTGSLRVYRGGGWRSP